MRRETLFNSFPFKFEIKISYPHLFPYLIFVVLILSSFPLHGSTIQKVTLDEMIQKADVIFKGTVLKRESHFADDQSGVFTFYTFFDIEVLKGKVEAFTSEVIIRVPGGAAQVAPNSKEKGPKMHLQVIAGMPRFFRGEDVVLFIKNHMRVVVPIMGLYQGVVRINKDPLTGGEFITDHERVPITGIEKGV